MVARAKYDAWAQRRGMSSDAAMKAYIELVDGLKKRDAAG
jgi:carboxylesterase